MVIDKNIENKIEEKTKELLEKEGLTLIEFKLFLKKPSYVLRVAADYPEGGITIADCARSNKLLISYLDNSGILGDNFAVEVVSPGLDRKLVTKSDFRRVKDNVVCVWLKESVNDKEYWEGNISGIEDKSLVLKNEKGSVEIPLEVIKFAKQRIEIK